MNNSNNTTEYSEKNIYYGNYSLFTTKSFFGLDDPVRFIKIIYMFINIILNSIIILVIFIRKKKKFAAGIELTSNLLIVNFIHTLSYLIQWVIKSDDVKITITNDGTKYSIGGLLIGNLKNLSMCNIQGFLLICSSISQDCLINVFFYLVNRSSPPSLLYIRVSVILGYVFPFLFAILYLSIGAIGINDRFCYVKKFKFDLINQDNFYEYSYNKSFEIYVSIIYIFRTINLGISVYLFIKILKYVRDNNINKKYILKSSMILIIQMATLSLGLIYRLSAVFKKNSFSESFSGVFLLINTIDGILIPLSYSLSNGIYSILYYRIIKRGSMSDSSDDTEDGIDPKGIEESLTSKNDKDKTFAMLEINSNNNFDLSVNS